MVILIENLKTMGQTIAKKVCMVGTIKRQKNTEKNLQNSTKETKLN
ncbi:MAG: hypothetical protein CM15mV25_1810 [uncultured marine virus]|nr:MAG: hypothetical protein CM15mV25_1810 [uncultured marine virus]